MPAVNWNGRGVAAAAACDTVACRQLPTHVAACSRCMPRVANIGPPTGSWSDGS